MSIFKKLFGAGERSSEEISEAEAVDYEGYKIVPAPIKEGAVFRVAARIEKEVNGEQRVQQLVRADTMSDHSQAVEISVLKAKQVIDQRGDALFEGQRA